MRSKTIFYFTSGTTSDVNVWLLLRSSYWSIEDAHFSDGLISLERRAKVGFLCVQIVRVLDGQRDGQKSNLTSFSQGLHNV